MELVLDLQKRYSYADYLTWADDKLRELMDGFIKTMSPAPSTKHQVVCGNLFANLHRFIKKNKGKCEIFTSPFDVRLPKNGEKADNQIYNVIQPDGKYDRGTKYDEGKAPVGIFGDYEINFIDIF